MSFLRWLFTGEVRTERELQRDEEIDTQIEMVNIQVSIQKEAERKFSKAYNKLTDKQKKIVDKHELKGFVFPTRGDWLDFKRYKCEELLGTKQEGKK